MDIHVFRYEDTVGRFGVEEAGARAWKSRWKSQISTFAESMLLRTGREHCRLHIIIAIMLACRMFMLPCRYNTMNRFPETHQSLFTTFQSRVHEIAQLNNTRGNKLQTWGFTTAFGHREAAIVDL
jgi:hypothetical protein